MKFLIAGMAAATLIGAGGAQAAEVLGAKTITITNALNTYLQVSEVIATQTGTGTDVALTSTAIGETTWQDTHGGVSTAPSNAVDGVIDGNYNDGTIYHSADGNGFLTLTLAAPVDLSSLTIYGRIDCCSLRDIYDVSIFSASGDTLYSGVLDATETNRATATFSTVAGVPEPGAWALMLMGFAGLGGMLRLSRRTANARMAA